MSIFRCVVDKTIGGNLAGLVRYSDRPCVPGEFQALVNVMPTVGVRFSYPERDRGVGKVVR